MKRIPALDGLRGVAILLVVVLHAWPNVMPGGGYGVTVFFVLSGFLITSILVRDADSGGIDFKRFYWNRAVRLVPALVVLLAVYLLVYGRWSLVVFAGTYTANIAQVFGVELGRLSHTWSLAVEEHFYVVWPLVVAWMPKRSRIRFTAGLLAVAVVWRLGHMDAESFRLNRATDTVAFALLAGCLLALYWHEGRLRIPPGSVVSASVAWIVAAALLVPAKSEAWSWVTFPVVALSVVAVAGCLQPIRFLEFKPLVWLGVVSYGLYLWHVPWIWSGLPAPPSALLAASLVFTWASWRWVEQPIRERWHRSSQLDNRPECGDALSRLIERSPCDADVGGGHGVRHV